MHDAGVHDVPSHLTTHHSRITQPHHHHPAPASPVEGANSPGLVYKVTELFFARGLRVDQLHTDTKIAPFGGTVLFLMDGTIVADKVGWVVRLSLCCAVGTFVACVHSRRRREGEDERVRRIRSSGAADDDTAVPPALTLPPPTTLPPGHRHEGAGGGERQPLELPGHRPRAQALARAGRRVSRQGNTHPF